MGEVREVRKEEQEGKQHWEPGGEKNDSKARVRVVKALTNGPIATPVPPLAAKNEAPQRQALYFHVFQQQWCSTRLVVEK